MSIRLIHMRLALAKRSFIIWVLFILLSGGRLLAAEARMNKLHSGIHLVAALDLFSPLKPDCLIPGRTEIVKPLSIDGYQLAMECIILGSATITEYGARAAFVLAKIESSSKSMKSDDDQLFYIHTHEEVNCREMTRRSTYDWYMNRRLKANSNSNSKNVRDAIQWNQGVYADADSDWSDWETISRSLTGSEKYLCSKWESMKNRRFY